MKSKKKGLVQGRSRAKEHEWLYENEVVKNPVIEGDKKFLRNLFRMSTYFGGPKSVGTCSKGTTTLSSMSITVTEDSKGVQEEANSDLEDETSEKACMGCCGGAEVISVQQDNGTIFENMYPLQSETQDLTAIRGNPWPTPPNRSSAEEDEESTIAESVNSLVGKHIIFDHEKNLLDIESNDEDDELQLEGEMDDEGCIGCTGPENKAFPVSTKSGALTCGTLLCAGEEVRSVVENDEENKSIVDVQMDDKETKDDDKVTSLLVENEANSHGSKNMNVGDASDVNESPAATAIDEFFHNLVGRTKECTLLCADEEVRSVVGKDEESKSIVDVQTDDKGSKDDDKVASLLVENEANSHGSKNMTFGDTSGVNGSPTVSAIDEFFHNLVGRAKECTLLCAGEEVRSVVGKDEENKSIVDDGSRDMSSGDASGVNGSPAVSATDEFFHNLVSRTKECELCRKKLTLSDGRIKRFRPYAVVKSTVYYHLSCDTERRKIESLQGLVMKELLSHKLHLRSRAKRVPRFARLKGKAARTFNGCKKRVSNAKHEIQKGCKGQAKHFKNIMQQLNCKGNTKDPKPSIQKLDPQDKNLDPKQETRDRKGKILNHIKNLRFGGCMSKSAAMVQNWMLLPKESEEECA